MRFAPPPASVAPLSLGRCPMCPDGLLRPVSEPIGNGQNRLSRRCSACAHEQDHLIVGTPTVAGVRPSEPASC